MDTIYVVLIIIAGIGILFFSTCYVCFRIAFFASKKDKAYKEDEMPPGEVYEPYYEQMREWRKELKTFKQEEVSITSYDGLTLKGIYYEHYAGAPVEIMFHGYRGNLERDLCGGLQRCKELKKNVLAVDHRAHGKSDGHVITFGIRERFDVKSWAEYAYDRFGKDVQLLITGISMGASSVLMASSLDLPETVVGVIADCGFSSAKDIICSVIKKMHLSVKVFYPFVKLGAKIFGKFDIDETSAEEEVSKSKLPIMLIHGDKDELVPCEMSLKNKASCSTSCQLEIFEGAGHGTSLLVDPEKYVRVLKEFETKYLT